MTPRDPGTVDALAAEYVLGTLRGPARRRFESWRASSPLAQERCRFWEQHLMYLARGIQPVRPPPHVWEGIRRRLNLSRGRPPRARSSVLAIAASVLLVAGLAALLYWRSTQPGPLSASATIAAPSGAALWQIELYDQSGRMIVHAGQLPARPPQHDYELWALPKAGRPVSLGILPGGGTAQRTLSALQREALANATQVAVTLEPAGGSPTGQPTTTPIYVVPLRTPS
jgi:anti-sigma-K factor RskA